MNFRKDFLIYTLAPLIILLISVSYYRFMVLHDYIVTYEGACDPTVSSCFVGCSDEECTEEYFYTEVEKYAADLDAQCGKNISECEDSNICLTENDSKCKVTYCDPTIADVTCDTLTQDTLESEINL